MEGQKRSIAELAHISTLSEEEEEELQREAGSGEDTYDGTDGYHGYNGDGSGEEGGEGDGAPETPAYLKKEEKPRMQHTDPAFTVTAKPDAKSMFDFMMYHTYHNIAGIASVLIGVGAIVALIFNIINKGELLVTVLLAVVIAMFLSNSPITIWYRAKKQAETIADSANTITYTFSSAGFDMTRGKDYAAYEWNRVERIIEAERSFYFYLSKNSAFVLPKEDLMGNESGFKRILENCDAKQLKLRKDE